MSYYDEPHLEVRYDSTVDAVVMEWKRFAKGDDFRDGLDTGLELVERKRAKNWLADLREMGTVAEEDQEWSNDEWFPRALQTCLHSMAIVKPEDVVANMSVENIMQEVGDEGLITHHFDNREKAREWLQDQTATL